MCYGTPLQVDCYGYDGTLPTGAFTVSNMTWASVEAVMGSYESAGKYHSSNSVCYNNGYANNHVYAFNILPAVRSWVNGSNNITASPQHAIGLKSTDAYEDSTASSYVCFGSYDRAVNKPYLVIEYSNPNPEPDPVLPALSSGVYRIRSFMTNSIGSDYGYLKDSIQLCDISDNDRSQHTEFPLKKYVTGLIQR